MLIIFSSFSVKTIPGAPQQNTVAAFCSTDGDLSQTIKFNLEKTKNGSFQLVRHNTEDLKRHYSHDF